MGRPAKPWWRTGEGGWFVTIRGKKVPLDVHDPGPDGRMQAQTAFDAMRAEVQKAVGEAVRRVLPAAVPADPDAPVVRVGTVAELVPGYVEARRGEVKEKARANLKCMLNWLVRRFGPLPVAQVSAKAVERAAADEEWTDGTRMMYLTAAQQFVHWCGRDRFKVKKPRAGSRGAEAVLSEEEFGKLVAAAEGDFALLLRFMWLTMCRPGEARTLVAEWVNWSAGVVDVKDHKTKHKGKKRTIYLSPAALALLEGQRDRYGSGHLFRNRRWVGYTDYALFREMKKTRARAGVRVEVVSNFLRHTGATRALEAGVPDADVAALMGHAGTTMLHRHYAHLNQNARRLREVATRADEKKAG